MLATLLMTAVMFIGQGTGLSPMPQPIPVALAARVLGHATPRPLLLTVGLTAHLLYGGAAGAVLWRLARRVTVLMGLGWGVSLWVLMGLLALPFLGWGLFGSALTPKIALVTLRLASGLWRDAGSAGTGPAWHTGRPPPGRAWRNASTAVT